jgi:Flp pilus assembly protein TadD
MFRPLVLFLFSCLLFTSAQAGDLKITLPKRSKLTPVQQLNRDGVKAIQNHDYGKAKRLFYKAYLVDPNDPFTLNNLGYIAELEGDAERAQRYYALAGDLSSEAIVDKASLPQAEGKPVSQVAGNAADTGMEINRLNVQAIGLLQKDRAPEADLVLQKALDLDRKNPFTLNNMGFAKEKEGELEAALQYYNAAAATGSHEAVVVTAKADWRGTPISEVAAENADKTRKQMRKEETVPAKVARLNLRGVSAINRNERKKAREYFEAAYRLDPNDAFTLNNMGYLAELESDHETADYYYARAMEAKRSSARVTVATRRDVEGRRVGEVAENTDEKIQAQMQAAVEAKRRQGGPVALKKRDGTVINEPVPQPTYTPEGVPVLKPR